MDSSQCGGNVGGDCAFEYGSGFMAHVEPTGRVPTLV